MTLIGLIWICHLFKKSC